MHSPPWFLFLALQIFHLLFLLLHDWVPLGSLNNVRAFQESTTVPQKVLSLLIPSVPVVVGLAFTLLSATHPPSFSFRITLSAIYGFLFIGELEAWWIPYTSGTSPERVALYRKLFGETHSFLKERHGITPNTLHVVLHSATLATPLLIWVV